MQKFDDEPSMEFNNINTAYNSIRNEFNRDLLIKWEEGKTGIPIIDACMRCLNETGYLNFRMRALIVSFFVHLLWQPWQACSAFLARQFLDFESLFLMVLCILGTVFIHCSLYRKRLRRSTARPPPQ